MPTPFPGMDPYLENPHLWPGVHLGLLSAIWTDLAPRLSPRYIVAVEERTYIAAIEPRSFIGRPDVLIAQPQRYRPPDAGWPVAPGAAVIEPVLVEVPVPDEVTERYLEIRDSEFDQVVTVIEVLSPGNKQPGSKGFVEYNEKRETVLSTRTSLVEIDLLRTGLRPPISGPMPESDYRILVHRGWERRSGRLYPFDLYDAIPAIPLPLKRDEEEPLLDLNTLLHTLYDQTVYSLRIDYSKPPTPPLDEADAAWASDLTRGQG